MNPETHQKSNVVYFDLDDSEIYINYKAHLNSDSHFNNMISLQKQDKSIKIDLMNDHNHVELNGMHLNRVLKYL